MKKTMDIKIGEYEISYCLENEQNTYYITVEEKENSEIVKTGRFCTTVDSEEEALKIFDLLCENQVGTVHVADIFSEFGYGVE